MAKPLKHLDKTGEPYFAATTGYQLPGVECIEIKPNELQDYLNDIATASGINNIPITDAFETITETNIDDIKATDAAKAGVSGPVIKLTHNGGAIYGVEIPGTGKCYWIVGKTLEQVKSLRGTRS